MKKLFLVFCFFLIACSGEKLSTCEKFLKNHPDIAQNFKQIECLLDTTLFYTEEWPHDILFLGAIRDDSLITKEMVIYGPVGYERSLSETANIANIKPALNKRWRKVKPNDMNRRRNREIEDPSFPAFRKMVIDCGLSTRDSFDIDYWNYPALSFLFSSLTFSSMFSPESEVFKKDSNHIYVQSSNPEVSEFYPHLYSQYRGYMDLYSIDGFYHRPLYLFTHEDENGNDLRGTFAKKTKITDSTFYAEYESGDWVFINEFQDSLAFHIADTAGVYLVEHYKVNGDTVRFQKGTLLRNRRGVIPKKFFDYQF